MTTVQSNLTRLAFKYLLGNTPALNVCQDLPKDEDAKALLLGTGDSRHILYSLYASKPADIAKSRSYEFVCCDYDVDIVSRNILLWAMLKDLDTASLSIDLIWNSYYHFYVDSATLDLIAKYASRLLEDADSLSSWHAGTYGAYFRITDSLTLDAVKHRWSQYVERADASNTSAQKQYNLEFSRSLDVSKRYYSGKTGEEPDKSTADFQTSRCAGPLHSQAMEDKAGLFPRYWRTGTTFSQESDVAKAIYPNPTVAAGLNTQSPLHYATDPMDGFLLANAYLEMERGSPMFESSATALAKAAVVGSDKLVASAKAQFTQWARSFASHVAKGKVTTRSFVGDAFAFGHALQSRLDGRQSGGGYRGPNDVRKMELDAEDWAPGSANPVPLQFNVIETTNLADHYGFLNILVATSGLLEPTSWSTMHTETMHNFRDATKSVLQDMLPGDLGTMGLLLNLVPCAYQTKTTCISTAHEGVISAAVQHLAGSKAKTSDNYLRVCWKLPFGQGSVPVAVDAADLASLVYKLYTDMFPNEDFSSMMSLMRLSAQSKAMNLEKLLNTGAFYTRGTLIALIVCITRSVTTDWLRFSEHLLQRFENDNTRPISMNIFQEVQTHLHMRGLIDRAFLDEWTIIPNDFARSSFEGCGASVVVTLRIPRAKLQKAFQGVDDGTPAPVWVGVQGVSNAIQDFPWDSSFTCLNYSYGTMTKTGNSAGNRKVDITLDPAGFHGKSDLFVSFTAPVFVLAAAVRAPSTTISLLIFTTPQSTRAFNKLGDAMPIFRTALFDDNYVTFSRDGPNGVDPMLGFRAPAPGKEVEEDNPFVATVRDERIVSLKRKVDFVGDHIRDELSKGTAVTLRQDSGCSATLVVGTDEVVVDFPVPVNGMFCKLRLARKSFWVEVTAPLSTSPTDAGFPAISFPFKVTAKSVEPWNCHRVQVANLPKLAIEPLGSTTWVNNLIGATMTLAERRQRAVGQAITGNPQLDFKESMHSILSQFIGIKDAGVRTRHSVYGLSDPLNGGTSVIIVCSGVRYDSSNHTIVLDAAVLPLTKAIIPKIMPFVQANVGLASIKVNSDENTLWRNILPAFVERGRSWDHKPTCEYLQQKKVPLSTVVGEQFLCSCGLGQDEEFMRGASRSPGWPTASKYATRVAISPVFPSSLVDSHSMLNAKVAGNAPSNSRQSVTPAAVKPVAVIEPTNCSKCGTAGATKRCTGCKKSTYCSKACQIGHWPVHKSKCTGKGKGR